MAELTIHAVQKDSAKILYPDGYINAHTVQEFEKSLQSILEEKNFRIIINCRDLQYINSSGLGVLMGVIEEIQENEGFLWLSNMNETVFNIFDTLGFTHLFNVYQTEEEAIGAITQ
ncbi:Anti-sigma factor antagonist [Sulfidibacter corallicola]|uniref:Anti-sigma factor antagonist n=1 Tax=Sulfidibacter corallicola TaxID=2818388 RepID=A0A8A4TVU2_SULCO|nr:STAS domain-containing protein [Sulfidibacter corallicola]QTD53288.1 STAS domain-containing protein [Sulfidibacter corallicola]